MNSRDKLKLAIYTRINGITSIITSRERVDEFRELLFTNSGLLWIEIEGTVNDIDNNNIRLSLLKEEVTGFDIVETNNTF